MSDAVCTIGHPIIRQLIAEGVISPRCRRFELIASVGEAVVLRQEVFVTQKEFEQLAKLLDEHHEVHTSVVSESQQDRFLDITPLGKDWREYLAEQQS